MPKPSVAAIERLDSIPDTLGDDTRVMKVMDLLQAAQHQHLHLSQAMLIDNHSEDDVIPQPPAAPGQDEPEPVTYGERLAQLDEGMRRLMDRNEDIASELAIEAHKRRRKAAKQRDEAG